MTPPNLPHARTALIPTEREIQLAKDCLRPGPTCNRVATLLARYRVELLGLDGTDQRLTQARDALHEIREAASAALAELGKRT